METDPLLPSICDIFQNDAVLYEEEDLERKMMSTTTTEFDPSVIRGFILDYDGILVKTWTTEILPGVREVLAVIQSVEHFTCDIATIQAGPGYEVVSKSWGPSRSGKPYNFPSVSHLAQNFIQVLTDLEATWIPIWIAIGDPKLEGYANKQVTVREMIAEATMPEDPSLVFKTPYEELMEDITDQFHEALHGHIMHKISADHEWRKPLPGMMKEIARWRGLAPHEILCVGDREEDLIAASNAGMPFTYHLEDVFKVVKASR